jgi:antitoxin (DNA-binding transcriptional repressor) of toxin-antitoxin stability system
MSTITLVEAQARLSELIEQLQPGVITKDVKPIARLTVEQTLEPTPRIPGSLRGTVLFMAPDFEGPLDDFKEYME